MGSPPDHQLHAPQAHLVPEQEACRKNMSMRIKLKSKKELSNHHNFEQEQYLLHKIILNHVQEQGVPDGPGDSGLGDVSIGILDPVGQVCHGCWEGGNIHPPLQLSPQEEVTCSYCISSGLHKNMLI